MAKKALLIIAIIVFVLAAIKVSLGSILLVPLGLAFMATSFIFE